jgi:hypothetical protein
MQTMEEGATHEQIGAAVEGDGIVAMEQEGEVQPVLAVEEEAVTAVNGETVVAEEEEAIAAVDGEAVVADGVAVIAREQLVNWSGGLLGANFSLN